MTLNQLTIDELITKERELASHYAEFQRAELRLDLTRGKPSPEQLALSDDLDRALSGDYIVTNNIDVRNYGGLEGIQEARHLGASLLGVRDEEVIAGGNASLSFMYQYLLSAWLFGPLGPETAWKREQGRLKFLCIVPGYDRHFTISEDLGFELLPVDMNSDGPNMDQIEELVQMDPLIKGIWCVPKYQNPTGYTFSEDTVNRFAKLGKIAGPNFRIMWDNAYAVHDLYDDSLNLPNLMDRCRSENTSDSVIMFGSTSKITRAGGGSGLLGCLTKKFTVF